MQEDKNLSKVLSIKTTSFSQQPVSPNRFLNVSYIFPETGPRFQRRWPRGHSREGTDVILSPVALSLCRLGMSDVCHLATVRWVTKNEALINQKNRTDCQTPLTSPERRAGLECDRLQAWGQARNQLGTVIRGLIESSLISWQAQRWAGE